jgi:uncharacterized protein YbaP (TraB family)
VRKESRHWLQISWIGASLLIIAVRAAGADDIVPAAAQLDEILVVGEQPGPALWRVSSGAHTLYILATLEPLPKEMVWRSHSVEERIAASQLVLAPPDISAHVGFFRSLTLVPSLLRARHDPEGRTLEQSLPHELYMRWLALRVKYLGNGGDEKLRPMLAALDLYQHAIDQNGMTHETHVWKRVEDTARAKHVPVKPVTLEVPIDNPKQYVRDLSAIPSAREIECLESTLSQLETELPAMRTRANLWSTGDIEKLRGQLRTDAADRCIDAVLIVPSFRDEYAKLKQQLETAWMAAAEQALAANASTVAVLPMDELLQADGWLAKFRAKGFEVVEP